MSEQDQEMTFETALSQLERIVVDLERGNLDLTASLAGYEKGVGLLARCQSLLDGVDRSVALLTGVDAAGNPVTTLFDASATVATPAAPEPVAKSKPKSTTTRKAVQTSPTPTVFEDIDPPF